MSLSLALMFERFPTPGTPILANNVLGFGYVPKEWAESLDEFSVPLTAGVVLKDGDFDAPRTTDQYGDPLTFVSAKFLAPRLEQVAKTPWEQAAVAFVRALPLDARVILWWH